MIAAGCAWLRLCTRLRLMQGLRPRHNLGSSDLHNARETILNVFNKLYISREVYLSTPMQQM